MLLIISLLGAGLLSGCEQDMSDLQQQVAALKARKSTRIPPIPQPKQADSFTYDAADRRDPFIEIVPAVRVAAIASGPRPNLSRNREPLEEFPLDALRMVGTITTSGGVFALIRTPDKVINRVTIGNYLGQNYGQIKSIDPTQVSLMELIEDGFGGWIARAASLSLDDSPSTPGANH
ncbi:pilus assembly protein PilP [Sinimarinibacterium sp. NLF-5-8]|nr:pilus assembly protein PilP [Sinimarinibacterium sp. NLF-5-8]